MTTPTTAGGAVLPVVAWRIRHPSEPGMIGHYPWSYSERATKRVMGYEEESLVRISDAQAEIDALRAELAELKALRWCKHCGEGTVAGLCRATGKPVEQDDQARDAERYRWLRDLKCNALYLTRDEDHACNYMTASDWIDNHPQDFQRCDPAEVKRMRDTNTIWALQVYPDTPISSYKFYAATPDAAIDAAIAATKETP